MQKHIGLPQAHAKTYCASINEPTNSLRCCPLVSPDYYFGTAQYWNKNNQDNALLPSMLIESVAHEQATVSATRNPEEWQPQREASSHTYTMSK
jgi:hypothetical protein